MSSSSGIASGFSSLAFRLGHVLSVCASPGSLTALPVTDAKRSGELVEENEHVPRSPRHFIRYEPKS